MNTVMSRDKLLARGYCCGMGCRNCPYDPPHTKGTTKVHNMNILVSSHNLDLHGLGTFIYTKVCELIKLGHNVEIVTQVGGEIQNRLSSHSIELDNVKDSYDLILTHQSDITLELMERNIKGYVIFTVHGLLYGNDTPSDEILDYIDKVFCVSHNIQEDLLKRNIESSVISQPIDCERFIPRNELSVKSPLVLSLVKDVEANKLLKSACDIVGYEYVNSGQNIFNIEDKIGNADIVVGLGRIIYEALACGTNGLVFDSREYSSSKFLGDGMITPDNIDEVIKYNFTGWYHKKEFGVEELVEELKKYSTKNGHFFRDYIRQNFDVKQLINKYLLK